MWNFIKNFLVAIAKTIGTILVFILTYYGICWLRGEPTCDICLALILAMGAIFLHYDKN